MLILTIAHALEVAGLEAAIFPNNCLNSKSVENEIRAGTGAAIVTDGIFIGYYLSRSHREITDILRLGVRKEYRGKGHGKALLYHAISSNGNYMLMVRKDNTAALKLYLDIGFNIVGELRGSWVLHLLRRKLLAATTTAID